jgi:hypothetical protein
MRMNTRGQIGVLSVIDVAISHDMFCDIHARPSRGRETSSLAVAVFRTAMA